jgi:hypothetical protein
MRMSHAIALMVISLTFASAARAHGGPPEIERVIASDLWGPWLLELSEGFAFRSEQDDDTWSFICPAAFGADLPPRAVTTAREVWLGREVFVSGATDLYRLNMLGQATAENRPDFASSRVLALAALDGGLLALRVQLPREAGGTRGSELVVLRNNVQETLFEDAELWSALLVMPTSDGPIMYLARIAAQGVELLLLSADGAPRARQLIARPASPSSVRFATVAENVFLITLDNSGYSLLYVALRAELVPTVELVSGSTRPIRGPALWGGEVVFTKDDQALRLTSDAGVVPSDSPYNDPTLSCLDLEFACAQSRLYANEQVQAAGGFDPDAAIFDLAELGDPISIEDSELNQYCSAQWAVFRADLVRAGIVEGGLADGGLATEQDAGAAGGTDAGLARDASVDGGVDDAGLPRDGSLDASDGGARTATACGCDTVGARERVNSAPMIALLLAVTSSALYARRRRAHAAPRS